MKVLEIYGKKFVDLDDKDRLMIDIQGRYRQCHYDIANTQGSIGYRGEQDNLWNIKVNEETRAELLKVMPVREGDVVLELGAYRGYGTLWLADKVGSKGKVIAVEADRENYEILKQNAYLDFLKRGSKIHAVNVAVTNSSGEGDLYSKGFQRKSLIPEALKTKVCKRVQTETIDNLLQDLGERPTLITMEINLAEIPALQGAIETLSLKNLRLILAGWYQYGGRPAHVKIKEMLERYGFKVYIGVAGKVYAYKE